jgi:hypothetical protein
MQEEFIANLDNDNNLIEWIDSLRSKYPSGFTPTSYIYSIDYNNEFKQKLKNWLSTPQCEKNVIGIALLIRNYLINKEDYLPPLPQLWRQNALPLIDLPF